MSVDIWSHGIKGTVFCFKLSIIKACLYASSNNLVVKETIIMQYKERLNNCSRQEKLRSRTQVVGLSLECHRATFILTREKEAYVGISKG